MFCVGDTTALFDRLESSDTIVNGLDPSLYRTYIPTNSNGT